MFRSTSVGRPTARTGAPTSTGGSGEGIENEDDCVRLGCAGHFAAEHVDGDPGVLRIGVRE